MKNFDLPVWKMQEPRDKNPGYQFQELFVQNIISLGLGQDEKLPSQRVLARLNGVSLKTMQRVYSTLTVTGWIKTVPGSGTFVARESEWQKQNLLSKGFGAQLPLSLPEWPNARFAEPAIPQNFITIGIDTLSPAFYPLTSLVRSMKYYQKKYKTATQIQQVTDLLGLEFREAIRNYFQDMYAFRLNPGTLNFSFDRAATLKCILALLLAEGDEMINTTSQDPALAQVIQELGISQQALNSSDPDFMARLEAMLKTSSIKVLYIRPQCSCPEGHNLSAEDCAKIVELAKTYHFYILEEDEYHEFWYDDRPFKPLARHDHEGHVIYLAVLSQLSVYMRNTMVVCACKEFIDLFRSGPKKSYIFRDLIEEKAIVEMLKSGEIWRHAKIARGVKTEEQVRLIFTLTGILGNFSEIRPSSSGLSLWLVFPESVNLMEEMQFLGGHNIGVPFHPGAKVPDAPCHYMRLGFGTFNEDEVIGPARLLRGRFET